MKSFQLKTDLNFPTYIKKEKQMLLYIINLPI